MGLHYGKFLVCQLSLLLKDAVRNSNLSYVMKMGSIGNHLRIVGGYYVAVTVIVLHRIDKNLYKVSCVLYMLSCYTVTRLYDGGKASDNISLYGDNFLCLFGNFLAESCSIIIVICIFRYYKHLAIVGFIMCNVTQGQLIHIIFISRNIFKLRGKLLAYKQWFALSSECFEIFNGLVAMFKCPDTFKNL